MNHRRLTQFCGLALAPALISLAIAHQGAVVRAENSPLIANVKTLTAPQPVAMNQMAPGIAAEEAKPTTPGGKLPQYQLGHVNRSALDAADPSSPKLRLLLALPDAPILVEATITVEGKPYLTARERRVQDLLKFATDPDQHRAAKRSLKEQAAGILSHLKDAALQKLAVETKTEAPPEPTTELTETTNLAEANESDGELTEREVTPEVAAVAEFVEPASVYERIERYMAATEERPTASELRWLLTDWIDGPPVLLLNDNYQRFRANQTPVFDILDRDRDNTVSEKELDLAVSSFNECDLNRDGLIQYAELAEVARDPRHVPTDSGHGKLTFLLPTEESATSVYERLAHRYKDSAAAKVLLPRFDSNNNGQFDAAELEDLKTREADVQLTIAFHPGRPSKSRIEISRIATEFMNDETHPVVKDDSITLPLAGTLVDFSAVQRGTGDQISVGAVDDGYPMLPIVDPNNDRRFTIRELRSLRENLSAFDINEDGALTKNETRSTIRVCIALGPLVHAELGSIRSRRSLNDAPTNKGPDWFSRMDGNKDGDLTREEFLGTDEQFTNADADADKLISAVEADAFKTE